MIDLLSEVRFQSAITATEGLAGTGDITSPSLDMANWRAVALILTFGAIVNGAVTEISVWQSDDDGNDDNFTPLAGAVLSIADTFDGKTKVVDIKHVTKRFLQLRVDRGTQNATLSAFWMQYRGRTLPPVQPTTVSVTRLDAPAETTS